MVLKSHQRRVPGPQWESSPFKYFYSSAKVYFHFPTFTIRTGGVQLYNLCWINGQKKHSAELRTGDDCKIYRLFNFTILCLSHLAYRLGITVVNTNLKSNHRYLEPVSSKLMISHFTKIIWVCRFDRV